MSEVKDTLDNNVIKAKKTPQKRVKLDPKGFFTINLENQEMVVEYYNDLNKKVGLDKPDKIFLGKKADALCDTIVKHVPGLLPEHYAYLGRELQKAEYALKENKKYVQGGC
ncbi:MAG: hypothetical protein DRN01_02035 [Thermoplasmata archaeon]|nr:MAG: DUF4346 domain-containing protein [Thermoplasmata archaeon]RLF27600.1 MAG: hypothetical protein DRN01_02035 [Thermoplasmata archaeon]